MSDEKRAEYNQKRRMTRADKKAASAIGIYYLSTTPIKGREGQIQTILPVHLQNLMVPNPSMVNATSHAIKPLLITSSKKKPPLLTHARPAPRSFPRPAPPPPNDQSTAGPPPPSAARPSSASAARPFSASAAVRRPPVLCHRPPPAASRQLLPLPILPWPSQPSSYLAPRGVRELSKEEAESGRPASGLPSLNPPWKAYRLGQIRPPSSIPFTRCGAYSTHDIQWRCAGSCRYLTGFFQFN